MHRISCTVLNFTFFYDLQQNGEGFGALADALLPFIEPESFADRSYHEGEEGDEEEGFLEESATHGSNTAIDGHQSNEMSEADFDIAEADALAHRDGDDSAHNGLDRNEVNEREGEAKSNSNSSSGWRAPPQVDSTIELAIVGRPNVGKSSLVRAYRCTAGEENRIYICFGH